MKRRLLIILLLGAVVNVAVAWGCAAWVDVLSPDWEYGSRYLPSAGEQLSVRRWKRAGATLISVTRERRESGSRGPTPEQLYPTWIDSKVSDEYASGLARFNTRWLDGRGWPRLSMWCELEVRPGTKLQVTHIRGGKEISLPPHNLHVHPLLRGIALPLLAIWPGFALNTLFYAAILWLLLIPGPFALRRFLRLRRGLCPKCAYPIGDSFVCTECGCELPQACDDDVKRRLLIIVLLGAVVNVAVAWGCAWWPRSAVIIYSVDQNVLPSSRDVEWWNTYTSSRYSTLTSKTAGTAVTLGSRCGCSTGLTQTSGRCLRFMLYLGGQRGRCRVKSGMLRCRANGQIGWIP